MRISFQAGDDFHLHIPYEEPLAFIEQTLHSIAQQHMTLTIVPNGEPQHVQMVLHFLMLHYPQKLAIAHDAHVWHNRHGEKEILYHKLHHLIDGNRYVAASLLLKKEDATLEHLLTFARRLSYGEALGPHPNNPYQYWRLLEQVLLDDVNASQQEIQFIQFMSGMTKQQQVPIIYYLHSHCTQLYTNSDLTDFVTFFYRLAEEALLYALGWDLKNRREFMKRQHAKQFVPLPTRHQHVTRHFRQYFDYAKAQKSSYAEKIVDDFSAKWLHDMIQLRHNGISGHGFEPYTKAQIEAICGGHPIQQLNKLLIDYKLLPPHCFYTLLKEAMAARARVVVPIKQL